MALVLGLSEESFMLVEGKIRNLSTRIELLEETARVVIKDQALVDELDDMISSARELNSFRNYIMHGQWEGASGHGSSLVTAPIIYDTAFKRRIAQDRRKKKSVYKQFSYTLGEMERAARRSIALSLHLSYWLQRAGHFPGKKLAGPPPWPYK